MKGKKMGTVIIVVLAITFTTIICGLSGFCGWELLEDKRWFWRIHRDKKVRKIILVVLLSTIGIPFVYGFIYLGVTMLALDFCYQIIKYRDYSKPVITVTL
ncbi:MAG: hypothetical protein WC460_01385 [Patescibacteria group bacterium]